MRTRSAQGSRTWTPRAPVQSSLSVHKGQSDRSRDGERAREAGEAGEFQIPQGPLSWGTELGLDPGDQGKLS